MTSLAFACCGSFCTLAQALDQMEALAADYSILPIFSQNVASTDTRFGPAREFLARAEAIAGRSVARTLPEVEPLGPRRLVDALVVCPCTGNTLSKIALGLTDGPVPLAVKSCLRAGLPVVLCVASNDALAASGPNLARLLNTKHLYFVPLRQDDPQTKPTSLVADFTQLPATLTAALQGRQLQPLLL